MTKKKHKKQKNKRSTFLEGFLSASQVGHLLLIFICHLFYLNFVRANADVSTVLTQFKRLCVPASFSSACASEHRGRDERDGRTEGAQPLCLHLLSPRPPPLIDPTLLLPFHPTGVSLPPQITPSMYPRPPSSPMLGLSSAHASQPGATSSCNH